MSELSAEDLASLQNVNHLQKKDLDEEALAILKKLLENYPNNSKVLGFSGLIFSKVGQIEKAIYHLEKASKTKPLNELLSLSLYVNYVEIKEYEMAFSTLFKYLESNPANMFKDTLEELLEGLLKGYGENYKDKIIFFAKKNNVTIPKEIQ